jgi:hypothetical protein
MKTKTSVEIRKTETFRHCDCLRSAFASPAPRSDLEDRPFLAVYSCLLSMFAVTLLSVSAP